MANPYESSSQQPNVPDTPEQARKRALLREDNEMRVHERNLASIDASLNNNPDKATLERMLKLIAEKMPEERGKLEGFSVGADIALLEMLAKSVPLDPEASALLEKRKKRHQELMKISVGTDVPESPKTTATVAWKPKETTLSKSPEYPPGTKILSAEQVVKMRAYVKEHGTLPIATEPNANRPQESVLEDRKNIEKKVGQVNLLVSIGTAYRDYLSNLEAHIRFKNVSEKPKRYQEQIRAIDSVLQNLNSVTSMPEPQRVETLKKLDIRSLTDKVLVPETKLSSFGSGLMNQPMFEIDAETGEKRIMPNIISTLTETEGRYSQMKALVTDGTDFSEASIRKKKYQVLELLRANDSRDDDSLRLNTTDAIEKQTERDILRSPELRKNESIRQAFDTVLNLQNDPKARDEFKALIFGDTIPTARIVDIFLQGYSIELPKDTLKVLSNKANEYRGAEEGINETRRNEISEIVDRPGAFPPEFVRKFKNNPVGTLKEFFELDAVSNVLSLAKREIIGSALKSDMTRVRELRKTDPALKLYTNSQGISHTADSKVNDRVDTSQFALEQLVFMVVAWWLGNLIARAPLFEKPIELASEWAISKGAVLKAKNFVGAERIGNLSGKSIQLAGTTITEWVPFALIYSSLSGLASKGYLHEGTVNALMDSVASGNSIKENSRIVAFLAAIKLMLPIISKVPNPQSIVESMVAREFPELATRLGTNPISAKALDLSRAGIQIGQNVTLDTAALVGADTVIRGLREEDLPKNANEIPNYLTKEFEAIIFYVVGLRSLTNTLHSPSSPSNMLRDAQKQFEVNFQKNGDIAIRTLEGEVVVIKKELRNLDQQTDRLRANKGKSTNGMNSRAIAAWKREKKAELKVAIANVDSMKRELAAHESQRVTTEPKQEDSQGQYEDSVAGVGSAAKKWYLQSAAPDKDFSKTSANHTAKNVKNLEIDPRGIRLSDTLSWFSPTLDTADIAKQFRELRKGMENIESPELLQVQAETVIRGELQTKYDAMMKDYKELSPEAQQAMDTWKESMEWQARELATDFQNALKTKLEWGKMDGKFGNPEYMDRIMETFAKAAPESLKKAISIPYKEKIEKHENKIPE